MKKLILLPLLALMLGIAAPTTAVKAEVINSELGQTETTIKFLPNNNPIVPGLPGGDNNTNGPKPGLDLTGDSSIQQNYPSNKNTRLPQTNEKSSINLVLVGIVMVLFAVGTALFGKKEQNNEK